MTTETKKGKWQKLFYATAEASDALRSLDKDFMKSVETERGRVRHMTGRLKQLEDIDF